MQRSGISVLPERLREAVLGGIGFDTEEIRIRANRRIRLMTGNSNRAVECVPTEAECEKLLELICGHSVFAHEQELCGCYVTLEDGSRVGLCGKLSGERGLLMPSSFNIRLAREVHGAADGFIKHIRHCGRIGSTLLISSPGAGKTTVLRDAARQLSNAGEKICIADERNELAACVGGVPSLDVGDNTDVMCGCKKAEAMRLMLRGMSPNVIITDEIASKEDAEAVFDASGCGISVIASAHAGSADELRRRAYVMRAVREGCFERVALLLREGKTRRFFDITEDVL